jgi:hypothetical protein
MTGPVDLRVDEVRVGVRASRRVLVQPSTDASPGGFGRDVAADHPNVRQVAQRLFVATQVVCNGAIGRALPRLAAEADLDVQAVTATTVLYTDFQESEPILKLGNVMTRAIQTATIASEAGRQWLNRVSTGPFLAAFTFITVIAQRPAPR